MISKSDSGIGSPRQVVSKAPLLREINTYAMDQVLGLEVLGYMHINMVHPWLHNMASHLSAGFSSWGKWQWAIGWFDDSAPDGRGGTKLSL